MFYLGLIYEQNIYSVFFAFCFLAGTGFCDLRTALALRKAT